MASHRIKHYLIYVLCVLCEFAAYKSYGQSSIGKVYQLKINETEVDDFPSFFYEKCAINSPLVDSAQRELFIYKACKIRLHCLKKDSFSVAIISLEYPKSYYGEKGLIAYAEYDGTGNVGELFKLPGYDNILSLMGLSASAKNAGKQLAYENPVFKSYFGYESSSAISGYFYDSLGKTLPGNRLILQSIDTENNDSVGVYTGGAYENWIGRCQCLQQADKLCVYSKVTYRYSFKYKQVNSIQSEIYIRSQGRINVRKKIRIDIYLI